MTQPKRPCQGLKTLADCVVALEAIDGGDPVIPSCADMHQDADAIVQRALQILGAQEIVDAYDRVVDRALWWAYA